MNVNLNREIKAYCPDFGPVRQLLRDKGAVFIETKLDFVHNLDRM